MDPTRYEFLEVIGTGGMATVWRARDRQLDRFVAVKRPSTEADLRRFEREGRLAAGIVHPNVVRVYDVGSDEDGPYLVMQLVDGPSVAAAQPGSEQAATIGNEIASALTALHAAGIVHGDVKPANILLADGTAHLTDFGVARIGSEAVTGPVFATPTYAAPEVAAGGPPTPASDVYSLAIVLHELVTGVSWSDPSMTQPLPVGDWSGLLAPALSTDPARRPDAASFARSLEAMSPVAHATVPLAAAGRGVSPESPFGPPDAGEPARHEVRPIDVGPQRRHRTVVAGGGLAVLAVLVAVGVLAARPGDQVESSQTTASTAVATSVGDAPATSGASTPTSRPATVATSVPASTSAPVTTVPPTTPPTQVSRTTAVAAELSTLIESVPPDELKPKDARSMLERLERVLEHVDDPRRAERELKELAERAERHLDDDTQERARTLIVELADLIGVDADEIDDTFDDDRGDGGRGDDDDRDDDDDDDD